MQPKTKLITAMAAALLISGCGVTDYVRPYRIDVRQGNYVTQDMVSHLKKGMTRDQVRFALGTPLLSDVFHADRWDYVYRFEPGHGEPEQRVLTVFFEDDRLARVEGDVVAGDPAAMAAKEEQRIRTLSLSGPDAAENADKTSTDTKDAAK
ncbi:outer membrane protein assembly factor BamE [Denitromonas iodatirespirans]|uniref:Outer membrane protein assembly factor BamE n=1 Tax=Denitromonas iodatirespirans TaxID=2795389 RepID=A0A944DA92_DENI1|nr:outer membrane protein assembly factor BamE [Denitromonas iodatirespirans]MBT0960752.1 outer membrane protein assembly factor BamE [Denitromonas iodatirespirans]